MNQAPSSASAVAALINAPVGVLILDQSGHIAWLNPVLEKMLDIEGDKMLGLGAASAEPYWSKILFAPEPTLFLDATATRPARWLQTWRAAAEGVIHYYADITDLQNALEDRDRLSRELEQHTTRDPLTGLPNQQALLQGLDPLVSRSRRYHNPLSVIRLRVGRLADIDREYGHGSGNTVLIAIGQTLKDQTRWADLIGRFDDDEFLLVLPETSFEAANQLLEKLSQRLATLAPAAGDGRPIALTTQFGVACWRLGDDRDKLLRRAGEQLEQGF